MQEVEAEKKRQAEEIEHEKEVAWRKNQEQQEALDRETALTMMQVENEKRRVMEEKARVEREKREATELALGLKAPAPSHWRNQDMENTMDVAVPCKRGAEILMGLLQASAIHPRCHGRDGIFEVGRVKY